MHPFSDGAGGRFGPLVVAIEQPTNVARATVFAAKTSEMLTFHQNPVRLIYPQDGWVEQDPLEILNAVLDCIEVALDNLRKLDINIDDIVSVGLCNQRETVIAWNSKTGLPLCNAINWLDGRSNETVKKFKSKNKRTVQKVQDICGLPLSSYFSAPKFRWLLDNNTNVKEAIARRCCKFGTVDSWLIWNLTGGNKGGVHVTDVTNASRTMLMSLTSLKWDPYLCTFFDVSPHLLADIKSSSEIYGYIFKGSLTGIPISGCLGDQQAALLGQMCLGFGQVKCTYGMGTFLLCNTGTSLIKSQNGLLTTIAYKFGPNAPTTYALEGSGKISGLVLDWLKLGLEINSVFEYSPQENADPKKTQVLNKTSPISNELMKKLSYKAEDLDPDEEGTLYFVPAFDGLYAPYWNSNAQSVICGLSPNSDLSHLITASSRSLAFHTRDMLEALKCDFKCFDRHIVVDGTLAVSSPLMQLQADICGIPIIRPIMPESSALGAAMAAGSAEGIKIWPRVTLPSPSDIFYPNTNEDERDVMYCRWKMAVERSTRFSSNLFKLNTTNGHDTMMKKIHTSIPLGLFIISSMLLMHLAKITNP